MNINLNGPDVVPKRVFLNRQNCSGSNIVPIILRRWIAGEIGKKKNTNHVRRRHGEGGRRAIITRRTGRRRPAGVVSGRRPGPWSICRICRTTTVGRSACDGRSRPAAPASAVAPAPGSRADGIWPACGRARRRRTRRRTRWSDPTFGRARRRPRSRTVRSAANTATTKRWRRLILAGPWLRKDWYYMTWPSCPYDVSYGSRPREKTVL